MLPFRWRQSVTPQAGLPKRVWICQNVEVDARENKTFRRMHNSALNTAKFRAWEPNNRKRRKKHLHSTRRRERCWIGYKFLHVLGIYPSFWIEIINIVSPLRCIKRGKKAMVVDGGIYSGWFKVLWYVRSDLGKMHGGERHWGVLEGTNEGSHLSRLSLKKK